MSTCSKVLAQTDTHTYKQAHRHDENITSTAYVGGNKVLQVKLKVRYTMLHSSNTASKCVNKVTSPM